MIKNKLTRYIQNSHSFEMETTMHIVTLLILMISISIRATYRNKVKFILCEPKTNSFRVLSGISLRKCMEECGRRQKCRRLNYRRPKRECILYSKYPYSAPTDNDDKKCVIITRRELEGIVPMCNCDKKDQVCQTDGSCKHEECPVVRMAQDRGRVYGNVLDIGSKVKITCNKIGFHRYPDKDISQCSTNGQWEDLQKCLKACTKGPCQQYPYCTLDAINGTILSGFQRTFTCNDGFYSSADNTSNKIHVKCVVQWFSFPNAYCRSDDVYPLHPENIQYKGCKMYEINDGNHTKSEAKQRCETYGDLAKVKSDNHMKILLEKIEKKGYNGSFWIQGKTTSNGLVYDDKSKITFKEGWINDLPPNTVDTGQCIILDETKEHKWNIADCNSKHGYICDYNK